MILFVDDEPFYVGAYVSELSDAGFEVSLQRNVAAAMSVFQKERPQIDLVITDIMIPSGGATENESAQHYLRGGFVFYDWVRHQSPDLPVIILTNLTSERSPDVDAKFSSEGNCWLFRKHQWSSFELLQQVKEILEGRSEV